MIPQVLACSAMKERTDMMSDVDTVGGQTELKLANVDEKDSCSVVHK